MASQRKLAEMAAERVALGSAKGASEIIKARSADRDRPLTKQRYLTERMEVLTRVSGEARQVFHLTKPAIVALILVFLVIGPGIAAIGTIMKVMPLWAWIGAIFVAILYWRNRT